MSERILLIDDNIEFVIEFVEVERLRNPLPQKEFDVKMAHDDTKAEWAEQPVDLTNTKFSLLEVLSITSEPD